MGDWGRRLSALALAAAGIAGLTVGLLSARAESAPTGTRPYKLTAPIVASDARLVLPTPTVPPTPVPQPTPIPYAAVLAISLNSAGVHSGMVVEQRGTVVERGREYFDQPSHPGFIAWYSGFGWPGAPGSNSVLSAHLNYFGYGGTTPFANLGRTAVGDTLGVSLADGRALYFTVVSVEVLSESYLNTIMDDVVYPDIGSNRERFTLITCAGDFRATSSSGAGEYDSRLIVVAERTLN